MYWEGRRLTACRRYLRARRWVPADALQQFKDTHEWREANDIDVLYNTIEIPSYEQSRRMVRLCPPLFPASPI